MAQLPEHEPLRASSSTRGSRSGAACATLALLLVGCAGVAVAPEASAPSDPAVPPQHPSEPRDLVEVSAAPSGAEPWNAWGPCTTLNGTPLDFAANAAAGKALVLAFWLPACMPCRREAPELVTAARAWADRALFVGVVAGPPSIVDEGEVRRAVVELGFEHGQLLDPDMRLSHALHVGLLPTTIVLDAAGRVLYAGRELPDWEVVLAR